MPSPDFETVEIDLLEDFFLDFTDHYQRSERLLLELERNPNDGERINDLFRSIHTIKGNLIYIGLKALSPLLQSVEDVLDQLRHGKLVYDQRLSDIILLSMDRTQNLLENILRDVDGFHLPPDFNQLCDLIRAIALTPEAGDESLQKALQLLNPDDPQSAFQSEAGDDQFLQDLALMGVEVCDDIRFINNMVPALEQRSGFWLGRSQRSARLALQINAEGQHRVTPKQLLMAALFHDLPMAFLPLKMLHKSGKLSREERLQMENHVVSGGRALSYLQGWDSAEQIVMQHHERCDGSGYPEGLKGAQICDGAKILAITDTFDAVRYPRAYRRVEKRPLIRAISEINSLCGVLFDEFWVSAFNAVIRQQYTKR